MRVAYANSVPERRLNVADRRSPNYQHAVELRCAVFPRQ